MSLYGIMDKLYEVICDLGREFLVSWLINHFYVIGVLYFLAGFLSRRCLLCQVTTVLIDDQSELL